MVSSITDRVYAQSPGVAIKAPCIAVATAPNPLSGLGAVGSYIPNPGDRILVIAQADPTTNGIYNASSGAWCRATDFSTVNQAVQGTLVTVYYPNGSAIFYQLTTASPIIGTTALTFSPFFNPNQNFPQTPTEAALGIIPAATNLQPGDYCRYGADPTGQLDSSAAILAAITCNARTFDSWPGGGTYLVNATVQLPAFPVKITGQTRWPGSTSGGQLNGTRFVLGTAAGPGNTLFKTAPAGSYGIVIEDIGFSAQTTNSAQGFIQMIGDLRYSVIQRCTFEGAALSNMFGIYSSATTVFTGGLVISDNFFTHLAAPLKLSGSCTTVKIRDNEFYGYTGANALEALGTITGGAAYTPGVYVNVPLTGGSGAGGQANITVSASGAVSACVIVAGGTAYATGDSLSAAAASIGGTGADFSVLVTTVGTQSGNGVEIDYPSTGVRLRGNYFEGFTNGIFSNGATQVSQVQNEADACVNGYYWLQTVTTFLANSSFAEDGVAGIIAGYTVLDLTQVSIQGHNGSLVTGGAMQSTRGFQEGNGSGSNLRAALLGYYTDLAPTLTANGGGVLSAITVNNFSYAQAGGTMKVSFDISATLTGAGTTALEMAIPLGDFPIKKCTNACAVTNNGAEGVGLAVANTTASEIAVQLAAGGAYTAGVVAFAGQIDIRVIS